jgi:Leucine-rich repeat (LRR) protein
VASQLTRLELSSPLVVDVSFIRACKQLEFLDLSGCMQLQSLAPLSACTKLLELHMDGCKGVKDPTPISTCVNLRKLSLGRWEDDEERGRGMTGSVTADGCPIDTLEHLLDLLLPLTQLDFLKIDCGGFDSLEGLEGSALSQLQGLSLDVIEWRGRAFPLDLGVLSSLSGLKELSLAGFSDDDVSWLPSCTSLEVLDLDAMFIDSFEAVRSCSPALRRIFLIERHTQRHRGVNHDAFVPLWDMGFVPFERPQRHHVGALRRHQWERFDVEVEDDGGASSSDD